MFKHIQPKKIVAALSLVSAMSSALALNEIDRYQSIHGTVSHQEDERGRSFLKFLQKGNNVALPKDWRRVAVEQVIDLEGNGGQTAFLMSYSEGSCFSKMSLAVVSKDVFWGPYAVGGCEDILIHQKSGDGNDFVSVRADRAGGKAWVYSSDENSFRSAVSVDLPDGLSEMLPEKDLPGAVVLHPKPRPSASATSPSVPVATVKPVDQNRSKYGLSDNEEVIPSSKSTVSKVPTPAPAPAPAQVQARSSTPLQSNIQEKSSSTKSTVVASVPEKSSRASTPSSLSPDDASKMAAKTKQTPPVAQIKVSL